MRKFAAITMCALIGLVPLSSATMAQNKAPTQRIERQAAPKQQVRKPQWKKGGKYNGRGAVVANHGRHKLKTPPEGQRWVRDGNDFILVVTATGVIASVVRAAAN